MINWFEQLSLREKRIVLSAGSVLLLLIIFLAVIEPIQKNNAAVKERLTSENILLEYMSKSAKLLVKQGVLGKAQQSNNTTPYILVDQSIKRLGLRSPDRMTPQGQKTISFRYKNIAFDPLIKLVQQLQTNGLQLIQMTTTKVADGTVSARIKMEK